MMKSLIELSHDGRSREAKDATVNSISWDSREDAVVDAPILHLATIQLFAFSVATILLRIGTVPSAQYIIFYLIALIAV